MSRGLWGFENPQAVYKWISGKSLPSLDNFLILSRLLHASIEDILVVDGDIVMSALFGMTGVWLAYAVAEGITTFIMLVMALRV